VNAKTLVDNINASGIHNGCRLLITPDLKLFITTGDASNQSLPQNKNALNGKILRINLDGSIPSDNPFPNNPVWSYGHRNSQGLVFANNMLYSSEHGPSSDDEINIIEKGRNYGPEALSLCNEFVERNFCNANNVKEPILRGRHQRPYAD
jgi:glucose/arabinose dehydrogenase